MVPLQSWSTSRIMSCVVHQAVGKQAGRRRRHGGRRLGRGRPACKGKPDGGGGGRQQGTAPTVRPTRAQRRTGPRPRSSGNAQSPACCPHADGLHSEAPTPRPALQPTHGRHGTAAAARSAPTSSSASVGFWPRDRITVPSSFVVMVPCSSSRQQHAAARRAQGAGGRLGKAAAASAAAAGPTSPGSEAGPCPRQSMHLCCSQAAPFSRDGSNPGTHIACTGEGVGSASEQATCE